MNALFKKKYARVLLASVGIANIAVAILHIAIFFIGVSAYRYFGAPESLIQLVQHQNSALVLGIMSVITFSFLIAGLYGLSGSQLIKRLPKLNVVLLVIGIIYTLRGSLVVLQPFPDFVSHLVVSYPDYFGIGRPFMTQDWVFSYAWLLVGLAYLIGWKSRKG